MTAAQECVRRRIAEEGALVREAVLTSVRHGEPRDHLYALVADHLNRPGKAMRGLLCLASSRLFGGARRGALDLAMAIELLHAAFLVHDDVEDGSIVRRGQPTLHVRYGTPLAINAGDGLFALAMVVAARVATDGDADLGRRVLREFTHLLQRTVEGQAMELGWIADARSDLSESDYLSMVMKKTCWYSTIHPLRIGALIGSDGRADVDRLTPFGFYLGCVFQLNDDLANLSAVSSDSYDKDRGGDILEGKRTLMLIHLLEHASESDRTTLLHVIGPTGDGPPEERIQLVLDMMDRYGSVEHAATYRQALAGAALAELRRLFRGQGDDPDVEFLVALTLDLAGADPKSEPEPTSVDGRDTSLFIASTV